MPYALINGCNLYYETGGKGAPVVYIHGGFAGLDTILRALSPYRWGWEHDFAAQFSFIAYDRRGCYRSSSPDQDYDLLTQAQDLAGLLDHLNIRKAHVIGSSAGGPIALVFAATQPHRVRSLILTGTALDLFPIGEPGSDVVRKHLSILEREGAEAAFDQRPAEVEHFKVSSKTVYHFTETAYRPELRAIKDRDCMKMLGELRSGRGIELETFYLSDWVKQKRLGS